LLSYRAENPSWFGGEVKLPPQLLTQLRNLEQEVTTLLELARSLGHVFIITNAQAGWVEQSARDWVPALLPLLEKIPIISARTRYETQFPGDIPMWKVSAFFEVKRQLPQDIVTNLVSVGDSNYEMDAVHALGKQYDFATVKTVKLKEYPSPEELLKELFLITSKFNSIVESGRNLKISLQRKSN
jgi:hypothetical protein